MTRDQAFVAIKKLCRSLSPCSSFNTMGSPRMVGETPELNALSFTRFAPHMVMFGEAIFVLGIDGGIGCITAISEEGVRVEFHAGEWDWMHSPISLIKFSDSKDVLDD